jgi:2-C-methyl-D-erythritol 4-phosphate cytidylyltransferase/2-C-methyl-D-erythritol 2,4-cyclodiphosphate synthase
MAAPRLAVIVTAAGRSERFGGAKKELALLDGRSVIDRALDPFLDLPDLEILVLTAPPGSEGLLEASLSPSTLARLGKRLHIIPGGTSRRASVLAGLERVAAVLGEASDLVVLVHDGARPWASAGLARRTAEKAAECGAALPVLPLTDTPKRIDATGLVLEHPARASMAGAQTPQGFRFPPLLAAHRRAAAEGLECTDDAELYATYVGAVAWIEGESANRKITFQADLAAVEGRPTPAGARGPQDAPPSTQSAVQSAFRIGSGWDLHRLSSERRLLLGGLHIPAEAGELAHSDGDVLLHAIIDAILGAAALGDIGQHFPPSDPTWKDADSKSLALAAIALLREAGWEPVNLDCTVVLEKPLLGAYKDAIRASIAAVLGMEIGAVSVKAKTKEGVDATGQGQAIESFATLLVARPPLRR